MIILLRHGESPMGGPDLERGLTQQGIQDARAAGAWLREHGFEPDVVLCSSALRTQMTAQFACESLGAQPSPMRALYNARAGDYLALASQFDGTVMIVGHNPTMTEALQTWTLSIERMRPASVAVIEGEQLLALHHA